MKHLRRTLCFALALILVLGTLPLPAAAFQIQHNISVLRSQYAANNNGLSKALEKFSSGYRVNRAGDGGAGLAISEAMRAQINGLDAAKKNASDAISLIKTAEGP